jgi:hypothetical protein
MTTRTPAELAMMSPQEIAAYKEAERKNVFGFDHKTDRHGNPIEQGIGSKGNESVNHFASMRKAESEGLLEAGTYDAALAEFWERDRERAVKLGMPKPKNLKRGGND